MDPLTPSRVYKCRITHAVPGIPRLVEVSASPGESVAALVTQLADRWGLNPRLIPIAHIAPAREMRPSSLLRDYDLGPDDEIDIWVPEAMTATTTARVFPPPDPGEPLDPVASPIDEEEEEME
jgi:hypothetical protein